MADLEKCEGITVELDKLFEEKKQEIMKFFSSPEEFT
jgi:hypothetical protein